jgi:hypothetical protein
MPPRQAGGQPLHPIYALKSDSAFRARYLADQDAAMAELALDAPARAAMRDFERDRLIALLAHPYLVFMAGLRVKMDRQPADFEHF